MDGLASAVSFVANASSAAVSRGLEMLKIRGPRDLRKDLESILGRTFPVQHVKRDVAIEGHTTRRYHFDAVVELAGARRLLIDPVTPEPNSINAHTIAHMDVSRLGDNGILQRMVYDDRDEWRAADLSLLQTAATIIPYSGSERVLRDIWRGSR